MAFEPDVPSPPDITNRGFPEALDAETLTRDVDLRREDLEQILRDNAWQEGFEEWWQYTDLTEADINHAEEIGLFHAFDFFWDGEARRLRYVTPEVPDKWAEQAEVDVSLATTVQNELDDLGDTVAETIATDHVDWGDAESSDLVWSVDSFGQVPMREEE